MPRAPFSTILAKHFSLDRSYISVTRTIKTARIFYTFSVKNTKKNLILNIQYLKRVVFDSIKVYGCGNCKVILTKITEKVRIIANQCPTKMKKTILLKCHSAELTVDHVTSYSCVY